MLCCMYEICFTVDSVTFAIYVLTFGRKSLMEHKGICVEPMYLISYHIVSTISHCAIACNSC